MREQEMMPEAEFHEVMERVQQEVEKADGLVDSFSDTFWALLSALVVNPLILMPYYTSRNGLAVSLLVMGTVSGIAHRCATSLHRCVDELGQHLPMREAPPLARDYAFIAHHAFGHAGSAMAVMIYTVEFWTAVVANFVIVDSFYRNWMPDLSAAARCLPLLGHAAATCILLYVPAWVFGKTQLLAALSSLVLVIAAACVAVPRLAVGDLDVGSLLAPSSLSIEGLILEVTSCIFACGNTTILPKITSSWQARPVERASLLKGAYTASSSVYVIYGALGFLAFGRCGPDAIFVMRGPLALVSQVFFLMRVQLCLPLLCSPTIHVLQDILGVARKRVQRVALSLALVFFTAALAIPAGGRIDAVMSLFGASVATFMVIVIPPLMELNLCGGELSERARGRLLAIAALGVLLSFAGTAAAWERLQDA